MKTKISRFPALCLAVAAISLATLNAQLSTCLAQGSLTPPGAPAPTMKSLDQIEPRTPISSAPFIISVPGSYYLTTNLTVSSGNAVTIATNGVTLDLNGYTISSTENPATTGYGILLNAGLSDITIANGHIRGGVTNNGSGVYGGSGFGSGIYDSGSALVNVRVKDVSVSGCLNYGIYLNIADLTVVEGCTVRTVGSYGIYASTIKASSAIDCGNSAIVGDEVSDCQGQSTGSSYGVYATTALNCYGNSSTGDGVYAFTALNCYGHSSSSYGVYVATAQNCYGDSSSGTGVYAYTAQNCYGYSSGNGTGLYASYVATGCFGYSSGGTGLYTYNAAFCTGSRFGGTAISATIANGCIAYLGTTSITYKYNMP